MNSLPEIVLWGALAVLLSLGLVVVLVCTVVFRDEELGKARQKTRRS
jgi:hypothetical protein